MCNDLGGVDRRVTGQLRSDEQCGLGEWLSILQFPYIRLRIENYCSVASVAVTKPYTRTVTVSGTVRYEECNIGL